MTKRVDWCGTKQKREIWEAVIARGDRMECRWCGNEVSREALYFRRRASLDHVIPRHQGGAVLDPSNIVISCIPCNSARTPLRSLSPPITERELVALMTE